MLSFPGCGCKHGSVGVDCNKNGKCTCKPRFTGLKCDRCESVYTGSNCDKCPSGQFGFPNCQGKFVNEQGHSRNALLYEKFELFIIHNFSVKTVVGVVGGRYISGNLAESYDTFETIGNGKCNVANFPMRISGTPQMFMHANRILVCGGYQDSNSSPECYRYERYRWKHYNTMHQKRTYAVGVQSDYGYFVFGGDTSPSTSEYLPKNSNQWKSGPYIDGGINGGCGVSLPDGSIFLIGGKGNHTRKRFLKYDDPRSGNPTTYTNELAHGRYGARCIYFNNKILITGGNDGEWYDCDRRHTVRTEIFDFSKNDFIIRRGGPFNERRSWHGIGIMNINDQPTVVAFGGACGNNWLRSVEIWDDKNEIWKLASYIQLSEKKHDFGFASVPYDVSCS